MKRLRTTILLAMAMIMSLSAQAQTKIYGNVIYSDDNVTPLGIYSFNAEDGLTFEAVKVDGNMNATNGGVYENGKYHFINFFTYYEYNAATWEQVKCENWGFMKAGPMQATALTYDETTDKVYGCFMDYNTYQYVFGTADYDKAERTAIKSLGDNIMRCMVATPEGRIYGINGDGTLYEFNKTTGDMTEVGSTGMSISGIQGAICDPKDGTVYWAACLSNGKTGLYELDLESASAMLISEFPNGEEVTGLFILPTADADATPKAVTSLKSNFANGSLTGNFSFQMPTESNLDETLTSSIDYKVAVDDNEILSGSAQPGEQVTTEEVTLTRGFHNVKVVCSNASGESLATYDFPYIGVDTPKAVENLRCSTSGGNTTNVTWNAVTEGVNGGYVGTVTYDVVRYPEGVKVAENTTATSFSETVDNSHFTRVWYSVTPCNDGKEYGETATCVPVTFGSVIEPPYTENFDTETSLAGYTVIDADNDGNCWVIDEYNPVAEIYSRSGSANDWLVTPAINLSADREYKLTLRLGNSALYTAQNYKVLLLSSAKDISNPVKTITSGELLNDTKTISEFFSVAESGQYYIAVGDETEASFCLLELSRLSINEGTLFTAPGHATDLKAVPAGEGALRADVSFTTPTQTLGGDNLADVTKAELYRNDVLVKTFDNPGKGTALSYCDEAAEHGENVYSVVAYADDLKGIETTTDIWVGLDLPELVSNVKAEVVEGGIQISWEPQDIGVHGGYVVPSDFRYFVQDNNGYTVALGIAETSVLDSIATDAEQALMAYAVVAYNEVGQSGYSASNDLLIGAPYNLPLSESFPDAATTYFWGINGSSNTRFYLSSDTSTDLDGGCVAFLSYEDGGEAELYSGKLNLKGNEHATVGFDYYCDGKQDARLQVMGYSPERGFKTLGTIDMSKWSGYRWQNVEFSLDEFIDDDNVQVYFVGTSTGTTELFYIDRIKLTSDATGIETVTSLPVSTIGIYDLQGRRLENVHKGQIIIDNGRKSIVR